jgi:competence protein ComEA
MKRKARIVTTLVLAASLAGALAAVPAARAAAAPAAPAAAVASESRPVDINTAPSDALQSVPGIGKSLAQRIIAFREKNGAFQTVDDLLKVQGIGEKSLQKLRPYLTVAKSK